ncbi:MAG: type II toxin-antitoxin system HicB family antitoxin [Bacteroidales bacterium]|nr:type II toxin-antitoxin system HicB family antitoxin [Bacteroidales bacterium]
MQKDFFISKSFKNGLRGINFSLFLQNKKIFMEYSIIIEKNPETGWYCGQCRQLPEALSQGKTLDELMANMKEAIELAIECREEELREQYRNRKVFHRKLTIPA